MCRWLDQRESSSSHPTRHSNSSLSKVGEAVNSMEEKQYQSPAADVLELYSEGVLCASSGTENLEENEGIW